MAVGLGKSQRRPVLFHPSWNGGKPCFGGLDCGGGLAALPRMRSQYFPDVVVDSLRVSVAWDGAGLKISTTPSFSFWNPLSWPWRE